MGTVCGCSVPSHGVTLLPAVPGRAVPNRLCIPIVGKCWENCTQAKLLGERRTFCCERVFLLLRSLFFFPSCISLRGFVDSVGRAKWKEFQGRRRFRVIARYADINQAVADGTKQIPRAGVGLQTCSVAPAARGHAEQRRWLDECSQQPRALRHQGSVCGQNKDEGMRRIRTGR